MTQVQAVEDTANAGLSSSAPSFPQLYESELVGPLFRPWAEQLISRASPERGASVLDVACGTGIVARLAQERVGSSARIVGIDRNGEMLAVARGVAAGIEWREGDADSLPLRSDETFDNVFCHQGLQFFPDKPAAVREMHRALKPGGAVCIGVWRSLEENGLFAELGSIAERFVGRISDARHSFADSEALAKLLADEGFSDVDVQQRALTLRFVLEPLARLNSAAVVSMSERGREMSDVDKKAAVAEVAAATLSELAPRAKDGTVAVLTSANIAIAYARGGIQ